MKKRIPLQFAENRIFLVAYISIIGARVRYKPMTFVVDTGSSASYYSPADVRRLCIPLKGDVDGQVKFAGSTYNVLKISTTQLHLLDENKQRCDLSCDFGALNTTKTSIQNIAFSYELPSIIGLDFLKQNKLSLHIHPVEGIAYLEFE